MRAPSTLYTAKVYSPASPISAVRVLRSMLKPRYGFSPACAWMPMPEEGVISVHGPVHDVQMHLLRQRYPALHGFVAGIIIHAMLGLPQLLAFIRHQLIGPTRARRPAPVLMGGDRLQVFYRIGIVEQGIAEGLERAEVDDFRRDDPRLHPRLRRRSKSNPVTGPERIPPAAKDGPSGHGKPMRKKPSSRWAGIQNLRGD
jgi:hypothetical protein